MARSTFKILFYINRAKVKTNGLTAVLCRITIDGKNTSISTGVNVSPENFKAEEHSELMQLKERIEHSYATTLKNLGAVTAESIKNSIVNVTTTTTYLYRAGEEERERLRLRAIEINSKSTYRKSKYSQSQLLTYLKSLGKEDIEFRDITLDFGEGYKRFLLEKKYCPAYINNLLSWVNMLIYTAVDKDIIRHNSLEELEYCKGASSSKHKYLTRDELQKIMQTPAPYEKQEFVRRAFIFSAFTALAYIDVLGLYPYHIFKTSSGRKYIKTNRSKTNIEAYIPLHPIAEQILSLYNTEDDTKPIFPMPNHKIVWYELQEIAYRVGLQGNLSYHQSRHSFGTLAMSEGMPVESISKMMGHSKISSTQIYAKVTEDKIANDMGKLIERRTKLNN